MSSQPQLASEPSGAARVIHHSALVLMLQVALLFCAVINNFLLAYLGGPEGKGVLYILQLIAQNVGVSLFHFSLGYSAIYFLGQERGHSLREIAAGMLAPSLLLGAIPAMVIGLSWPWTAALLTRQVPALYLWIGLLALPAAVLSFNAGQFSLGRHRIREYNTLGVSTPVILALGLIGLFIFHVHSIKWLVGVWTFSIITPTLYAIYLIKRPAQGMWLPRRSFFRCAFQFIWRSHLGGVTQHLQHRLPVLMVGFLLPISQLGIYSVAVSLAEVLWYLPNSVSTVLMPHVASSTDSEASRTTPTFCRIVVALTAVLALGLVIVSSVLVPFILPAFRPSLPALFVLLPGVVIATVFKVLSSDLNGRGRPLQTFYPALVALVAEFIVGMLLIPRYGITAAAATTTFGYALNTLLYGFAYKRLTSVRVLDLMLLQSGDLRRLHSATRALSQAFRSSMLTSTPVSEPATQSIVE